MSTTTNVTGAAQGSAYGARFLGVIGVSSINADDVTGQAL
jgi:hypothetical protein